MDGATSTQLPVTPLEEKLLESSGVLRENPDYHSPRELSTHALDLFVLIASAGEEGLLISALPRRMKELWPEAVLELELHSLAQRERNSRGHIAYLCLSWLGQEIFEQARANNRTVAYNLRAGGWGSRRRCALQQALPPKKNASNQEWKEALSTSRQNIKRRVFPVEVKPLPK